MFDKECVFTVAIIVYVRVLQVSAVFPPLREPAGTSIYSSFHCILALTGRSKHVFVITVRVFHESSR